MSKTKIVATLGPSSSDVNVIRDMIKAGMNVARLNFSHGSHESHGLLNANARLAAKKAGMPLAILQDLGGPKIRIGDFDTDTVTLIPKHTFTLTTKKCVGTVEQAWINYAKLPKEVEPGMTIMVNDGKLKLEVVEVTKTDVITKVIVGGTIRGRRGVNVPDANLSIAALTEKDRLDLAFGQTMGVDFVTLSFVRSAQDILELRELLGKHRSDVNIVAKIETRQAVEDIDAIIAAADAVMIARGDLAIEVPREEVPLIQKQVIRAANKAGKPAITATQMLDSMRENVIPTRAEVNDIANAILDGTDAVMLSDESAVGLNPALAVETMSRVAQVTEESSIFSESRSKWDFEPISNVDAVSRAIAHTAARVHAKAIVAFSESGYTGRMVARYRPSQPVIVLTPSARTFTQSLLTYGCIPAVVPQVKRISDALKATRTVLAKQKLAKKGDSIVVGAGLPFGKPGETNMMLVEKV